MLALPSRPRSSARRRNLGLGGALVAICLVVTILDHGFATSQSQSTGGIVAWWSVLLAVVLGVWPAREQTRAFYVVWLLLAAFAGLSLASAAWGTSAETALREFNRATLYLAVLTVTSFAATNRSLWRWVHGAAIACAATTLVAFGSRVLPSLFPSDHLAAFLPSASTRLSFPLGYWNGLGILVAIGLPLLLASANGSRPSIGGMLLGVVPVGAVVVYLTSSRGAVIAAATGLGALFCLARPRWPLAAATAVAATGGAVAVLVVLRQPQFVDGPLNGARVSHQGHVVGIALLAIWATIAVVWPLLARAGLLAWKPPRLAGPAVVAVGAALLLAAALAAHPASRFDEFKAPPGQGLGSGAGFATQHLLSGNGSGRWQFWVAALDQFRAHLLFGGGAGSFAQWWAQHASFPYFVRDAHSLYLQTLGELGLVGFLLIAGVVAGVVLVGVQRARSSAPAARLPVAAAAAAFVAFALCAGIDWMWQLPAVTILGFVMAGIVLSPGASSAAEADDLERARPLLRSPAFTVATIVVAWPLICLQAIPLLAGTQIARSQQAAARGRFAAAEHSALTARKIEPWATTPYLQLALVEEVRGRAVLASEWLRYALDRDPRSWQLWLIEARIQTELGDVASARTSLRRAVHLNPKSPIFQGTSQ